MDNIKISASFNLQGSIMYSEQDKEGNPVSFDINTINFYDKKKHKTNTIKFKTSRCKPCVQTINMSLEAYQAMMNTPTEKISVNHWKRMSANQRIAEHLKEIQNNLGATSFEFTIFED